MLDESQVMRRLSFVWGSHGSAAALQAAQFKYLRELLVHAEERIPFYRDLFQKAGVSARSLSSYRDFIRFPVVKRSHLQTVDPSTWKDPHTSASAVLRSRSSGSSGRPMEVWHTPLERHVLVHVRSRVYLQMGFPKKAQAAYVGIDSRQPENQGQPSPLLGSEGQLHVVECRRPVEEILDDLLALRPNALMGYSGVLTEVAALARKKGITSLRPQFLSVGGEVLTPAMKTLLGEVFGGPVLSTYACTEAFWLGGKCLSTDQMHLCDDSVLLEVVDERHRPVPPGERGEVLITSLHGFTQPLIRYALGDIAIAGSSPAGHGRGCSCGAPYSTLGEIYGRQIDYLRRPDGSKVHSYQVSLRLRESAAFMSQYRLVQDALDHMRIELVCQRDPSETELGSLRKLVQEVLGSDFRVDFAIVPEIPREPSGKFKVVVNHVGSC